MLINRNIKYLLLLLATALSVNSFAQLSSYQDGKSDALFAYDIFFSAEDNYEGTQHFILSAKDNFEFTIKMDSFKDVPEQLEEAFESADCAPCLQVSEKLTNNPIDYIFDVIEYQDVFLVTEFENQYKVILYQPKEDD